MIHKLLFTVFAFFLAFNSVSSQSLSIAKDYYNHNLRSKALEQYIQVYNTGSESPEVKAEALYYMGMIAFDENQYATAIDDWNKLVNEFPTSEWAINIKERIEELKQVFSNSINENISSSIAKTYIKSGDFWSDSKNVYTIDSSWMPKVELAIEWYDRVIAEFPGTVAAETAYRKKLFAILGWDSNSQYTGDYGLEGNPKKYMPLLLETFNEFEAAFPKSTSLQGFRYQIAQAYWGRKDVENARLWLNKVIEKGEGKNTFYTETAKARLNNRLKI